jgi:hypothetical protein
LLAAKSVDVEEVAAEFKAARKGKGHRSREAVMSGTLRLATR